MREFKYVGSAFCAPETIARVNGALRFGADLRLPGMLHAQLVLSPHAHARVTGIDPTRALAIPGVAGVYSHHDAPTRRYCRYRILPAQAGCIDDEPLFASTPRFVGDRVAAVVATSRQAARAAAREVDIRYAPLPAVLSPEASLEPDAAAIQPGGNLISTYDLAVGDSAAKDRSGDTPAVITVTEVRTPMLHHAALEPHLCLADCDSSGQITVWSPCQSVYGARTVVADLLGLPYNRVRVVKVPMGGSFGGKQEFILEPVTAFLAMQTGKPVLLVLDREECIRATMVRPEQRSVMRSTTGADGRLGSLDIDTLLSAGAYAGSSPDYAEAMAHKLTRLYRFGHYRHRGRVAYTNGPVGGGMRGWGAPDIATCAEIHLDHVAAALGMDPVELRRRNLVAPGDIDPLTGKSVGDARVRDCLDLGARAFRWSERVGLPPGDGRWRRGVGLACGAHKNGVLSESFPEFSTMTLKMNEDGSLDLNASVHEVGAGTLDTLRTIIAEELDIDPASISAREADTASTPYDFGCFGSRMTYVCGAAALQLAALLRERLVGTAAELLGAGAQGLTVRDGAVWSIDGGGRGLAYADIVQRAHVLYGRDMIVTHTYRGWSNPGSYAVQFAGVEVDVLTGLVRVTDVLAAIDIGRAINRQRVEGQCGGAIQAGIGSALCEEVDMDAAGRAGVGGFRNYHMFNAVDMPPVTVLLVEHDGDDGPYGAKSVGEVATVPTAAAIVNAVNRALGTRITTLPLTPERIVAALCDQSAHPRRSAACC